MYAPSRGADVAVGWRLLDGIIAIRRRMRWRGRTIRLPKYALVIPGVVFVGILAWGLGSLVWKSFHAYDSYLGRQGGLSLDQYRTLFAGENAEFYRTVLIRTITISALVTVTSIVGAIPVSYLVVRTRHRWVRLLVLALALIPFLMGEVVRAFGWLLLVGRHGVAAWVAKRLGDDSFNLIGNSAAIWLGASQTMLPLAVFIMLPAVRRIQPDLERAAGTLGARPSRVWLHVVVPLLRPGIVAVAVVVFSLTMTEYAIPDILGGGVRPFAANAIQGAFFMQGNVYLGSALAVVLLVLVVVIDLLVLLVFRSRARRPESVGAVT
jgi:putative spermidine/putrescine transport system permease protein